MGSLAGRHHMKLKDFISWFEIPVYDIHRAARFYGTIYSMEMEVAVNGEFAMAYFPVDKGIGGALIYGPGCVPSDTGTLVYLNAGNDLDGILGRVDLAGGRVIMPKSLVSEAAGWFALFIDSEGNRVALHQGAPGPSKAKATTKPASRKAAPRKAGAKRR
ncbi:MAG: VOC family protein [Flavobacteriales bacterium]|nr:MAG: VOC family protein [Flavobacteriales bacterium]